MSASYIAISKYNFSLAIIRKTLNALNATIEDSSCRWKFDGEYADKSDQELLDDLEDGYISISPPDCMEILISKNALVVSSWDTWKFFLSEKKTRSIAIAECEKIARILSVSEQVFVPDATFLPTSPLDLFVKGESFVSILEWAQKNLREINSFDEFSGSAIHHDVFFRQTITPRKEA